MDDASDDDFNFDLDEIVKINTQPSLPSQSSSHKSQIIPDKESSNVRQNETVIEKPIKTSTTDCDWGSDDDSTFYSVIEPDFHSTPFPTAPATNKKQTCSASHENTVTFDVFHPKTQDFHQGNNNLFNNSQITFIDEPDFHSTPLPSVVQHTQLKPNTAPVKESNLNVKQLINKPTQNYPCLDAINNKNKQLTKAAAEKPKARFPGPAGVLAPIIENPNIPKGQQHKVMSKHLMGTEGLVAWDLILEKLELTKPWESKKINLQLIKRTFVPGSFRLRVPLLVVGVQKVDYPPVIQEDVRCVLQDPTGEAKGCIVKDVITNYGTQIHSGSILILRRPMILHDFPTYHVLITVSSLLGIYSPKSAEIKYCQEFTNKNLLSWLSDSVDYGDIADVFHEKPKSPVKLFTTYSDLASTNSHQPPYNGQRFQSPAPVHPPVRPYTPRPNYNQQTSRPPGSMAPPRSVAITPNPSYTRMRAPSSTAPPTRPPLRPTISGAPSRPPASAFQFKAPSAMVSTPRSAPYSTPVNRIQPSSASIPSSFSSQEPPSASEEFLSQFLEGVDTDSLFDDF